MNTLHIEIWSDIACPWCWVGKRGLDAALESFNGPVTVRWNAFELDPNAPRDVPERVDYAQRLAAKYGVQRDAAQEMIDRMVASGRDRGLELRFDRIRPTNTFDAHRLLAWARETGRQAELTEALFNAYLREGRLVSDPTVLIELVEQVGLEGTRAQEILSGDAYASRVRDDERRAAQIGVTAVPCFVFPETRSAVSGAQPAAVLLEAMNETRSRKADGSAEL
ncbi:MAG: DsbA family oxidoreductase [Xanthomonadales bacterium]|nr:DsbA family oxidoreductase [Xanthomonadales bacterium]